MNGFFILVALLSSTLCSAQYVPLGAITQWTDGYVVTIENDTIRGRVRVGAMVNDSPASIIVETAPSTKIKLKGDKLRLIVQRLPDFAYSTGYVPRERELIVFERIPHPRRGGKPMLLERLTPFGGRIALYFDPSGWKKTTEYTFGNFVFELNRQELSYVVRKDGQASLLAKRSDVEAVHDTLFGDCPLFRRNYPTAIRKDWNRLGELVDAYNRLCPQL